MAELVRVVVRPLLRIPGTRNIVLPYAASKPDTRQGWWWRYAGTAMPRYPAQPCASGFATTNAANEHGNGPIKTCQADNVSVGRQEASFRLSYCKGDNLTQNLLQAA